VQWALVGYTKWIMNFMNQTLMMSIQKMLVLWAEKQRLQQQVWAMVELLHLQQEPLGVPLHE
jgi:hypothetical protein